MQALNNVARYSEMIGYMPNTSTTMFTGGRKMTITKLLNQDLIDQAASHLTKLVLPIFN
jgi:hypothetical protein